MITLSRILLSLIFVPFFLFGKVARDSDQAPAQFKVRMPEWRLEIVEQYQSGKPKVIHFYAENDRDQEELVKKVYFYEEGQRLEETDFTILRKEDFEDSADYDKRYDKWKSTSVHNGMSARFFDNGKVESISSFDRGFLDGEVKFFYPTGQPKHVAHYKQDVLDGSVIRYHENGEIAFDGEFSEGKPKGKHVHYYDSGEQKKLTSYDADGQINQVIEWHPNGNEKAKLYYLGGELHSKDSQPAVLKYNEDHNIIETQEFDRGVPCNEHIQFYPDGKKKYFAFYIDGEKHGSEKWFDREGADLGESQYNRGLKIGKHWKKHANGKMAYLAIYDQQGNLKEPILEFNEEGQKVAEYTIDQEGKYQGAYQTWHGNGQLAYDYLYIDGEFEGEQREFFSSGQLMSAVTFQKGVKHGPFKQWHEDGSLAFQGQFREDNQDGEIVEFHPNGKLKRKSHYKNFLFDGPQEEWYENGVKGLEAFFVDGKEDQKMRVWSAQGQLIFEGGYHLGDRVGTHTSYFEEAGKKREVAHFRKGKQHGKREVYYPDGQLQLIEFYSDGDLEGRSKGYYEDGSLAFDRNYESGHLVGKQQEFFRPDAAKPKGSKPAVAAISYYNKEGNLHGEQKSFYAGGVVKTLASYANGQMHGFSASWNEQGELITEANYAQGKLEGRYFIKDSEGSEIIYHYQKNKREGLHVVYYPKKPDSDEKVKALEVQFKKNKLEGDMIEYSPEGIKVSTLRYENGIQNGPLRVFYRDGKPMLTATFEQGKQHGVCKQYFQSGKIQREVEFVHGFKEGDETTYFGSGKINSIYRYKEGKLQGLSKHWNEAGVLIFEGEYDNGLQHGKFIKYYDDGKIRLKQHFLNGKLDGVKESYDKDGKVSKTVYRNGVKQK
ncbi:MAG: hypothetical protein AAF443_07445 [Chlamydiota bacterium]